MTACIRLLAAMGTAALLCAALLLAGAYAFAQQPAPASGTAASGEKSTKVQIKHAARLYYDATSKIYHLTGGVILVHEDVTMVADQCDYDDNNNTAQASGHLKITDPESTLTGDLVKANFDQKLVQITGNVTIVTQKKKEEAKEGKPAEGGSSTVAEYRQKKTTITCPQIDYYYADDKKQATVYGPLKAVQEDKTVYADKAFYDGIKDTVTLEGNIRLITSGGSEFRCPKAIISLKEDWIQAEDVTGVAVEEKEKPAEEKPPTPGEATPPAAPQ